GFGQSTVGPARIPNLAIERSFRHDGSEQPETQRAIIKAQDFIAVARGLKKVMTPSVIGWVVPGSRPASVDVPRRARRPRPSLGQRSDLPGCLLVRSQEL